MSLKSLFAAGLLALTSCAASKGGYHLVPDESLRAAADVYPVRGRQGLMIHQKMKFGPYHTTSIHRGAITGGTTSRGIPGIYWAERMKGREAIRFSLTDDHETVQAEAVSQLTSEDIRIDQQLKGWPKFAANLLAARSAQGSSNNFSVALTNGSSAPWQLFIDNTVAGQVTGSPAGFLSNGSQYYSVVPVNQVTYNGHYYGMPSGGQAFELMDEAGRAAAAVLIVNAGEVQLSTANTSNRAILAAACSALLLRSDIKKEAEKLNNP